jgi:drug/metabolite transporter (DMT)-like permease
MNPRLAAALWVLGSTFAFALVYSSGKLTGGTVSAFQIVLVRYASGFVVALIAARATGHGWQQMVTTSRRSLHFLRALCGAGAGVTTIYATLHMPLADAAALGLTQGLFVVLLALLFLGERLSWRQALATLVCALGALTIVRGEAVAPEFVPGIAPALALFGAFLVASEVILLKFLSARESATAMLVHVNGFAALILAVPVLWLSEPMDLAMLAVLCLLGPLALCGQWFNVQGYRLADASFLAPFTYSYVLFSAAIGFMAQGEVPSASTWLGALLIAGGGLLLLQRQARPD